MTVGIVCYPTFGGSGVVATELAKGLAKRGHKVHIISYARPARLDSIQTNITFHEVDLSSYPLFEYPPYDLALANLLANLIIYEKLDVLHVHYAIPHATSAWLAKQIVGKKAAHVPIITTLHGTDITIVGSDPSYKKVVDFSINQSDGVTAVSEFLKKETNERFDIRKEIRVISNFIDLDRFRRGRSGLARESVAPDGGKVIVHVSNFREVKRVPDVVSIFHHVLESGIQGTLLMVGDGPDRARAEQRCRDLGICGNVRFMGKQEKVEEILSIADLFLIPSGSETFGLAALEAMACGVPVISSNTGGLPEVNIHGETGYHCDLGDTVCMGRYAVEILNNPDLHKKLSEQARKRAGTFELSRLVAEYESFYDEIRSTLL